MGSSCSLMEILSEIYQSHILEHEVQIGSIYSSVCSCYDRCLGLVQDFSRKRLINALFSRLPSENPLSLYSRADAASMKDFAKIILTNGDHLTRNGYSDSWKSSCFNAMEENKNASNICNQKMNDKKRSSYFHFVHLHQFHLKVNKTSVYFLSFLILKVN